MRVSDTLSVAAVTAVCLSCPFVARAFVPSPLASPVFWWPSRSLFSTLEPVASSEGWQAAITSVRWGTRAPLRLDGGVIQRQAPHGPAELAIAHLATDGYAEWSVGARVFARRGCWIEATWHATQPGTAAVDAGLDPRSGLSGGLGWMGRVGSRSRVALSWQDVIASGWLRSHEIHRAAGLHGRHRLATGLEWEGSIAWSHAQVGVGRRTRSALRWEPHPNVELGHAWESAPAARATWLSLRNTPLSIELWRRESEHGGLPIVGVSLALERGVRRSEARTDDPSGLPDSSPSRMRAPVGPLVWDEVPYDRVDTLLASGDSLATSEHGAFEPKSDAPVASDGIVTVPAATGSLVAGEFVTIHAARLGVPVARLHALTRGALAPSALDSLERRAWLELAPYLVVHPYRAETPSSGASPWRWVMGIRQRDWVSVRRVRDAQVAAAWSGTGVLLEGWGDGVQRDDLLEGARGAAWFETERVRGGAGSGFRVARFGVGLLQPSAVATTRVAPGSDILSWGSTRPARSGDAPAAWCEMSTRSGTRISVGAEAKTEYVTVSRAGRGWMSSMLALRRTAVGVPEWAPSFWFARASRGGRWDVEAAVDPQPLIGFSWRSAGGEGRLGVAARVRERFVSPGRGVSAPWRSLRTFSIRGSKGDVRGAADLEWARRDRPRSQGGSIQRVDRGFRVELDLRPARSPAFSLRHARTEGASRRLPTPWAPGVETRSAQSSWTATMEGKADVPDLGGWLPRVELGRAQRVNASGTESEVAWGALAVQRASERLGLTIAALEIRGRPAAAGLGASRLFPAGAPRPSAAGLWGAFHLDLHGSARRASGISLRGSLPFVVETGAAHPWFEVRTTWSVERGRVPESELGRTLERAAGSGADP